MVQISKHNNVSDLESSETSRKRRMAPTATARMPITLCSVVPIIPWELEEHAHLEEDLTRIGCIGLISKPWMVKDEKMVRQAITGAPNQFNLTICGKPETWTVKKWRETYGFQEGGEGSVSKINKFICGKFQNLVSPKDGFVVVDCKDMRAKRVLEFLIPIVYLEKPIQVMVMMGKTIFGALLGERKVN